MTAAFAVSGLCKRYAHFALQEVSLSLAEGEVMGLVGVNGAGKSTLLRLLTGLAAPDAGSIEVLGHRLPQEQVAAKRAIGFAAEDMRLYRGQTLDWHIALVRRIYPEWDEAYAANLIRRFDLRPQQAVGGYSHGQRVKALLLLCLARRPRLLLLDEPSLGLAPLVVREIFAIISELHAAGVTILLVEQNANLALQSADRGYVLEAGRLTIEGPAQELLNDERVKRAYLG